MADPKPRTSFPLLRPLPLLLLLWTAIALVYAPSYRSGLVAEFLGLFHSIDQLSFFDFINRSQAEVKSFYQLTQLQLWIWIRLFGSSFVPWFLLFTFLHAVVGTLSFFFFRNLFADFSVKKGEQIALTGMLFFLLSPNITEVTIWRGGYHYLTGMILQLSILSFIRSYLLTLKIRYVWLAGLFFFLSIFTLEIFYITPILSLALIGGYRFNEKAIPEAGRKAVVLVLLPQLMLFGFHLLIFRLMYGSWIAHYGVTADFKLDPGEMVVRMVKYLCDITLFTAQYPTDLRLKIYGSMASPALCRTIIVVLLLIVVFLLSRFRALSARGQVAAFLLTALLSALILISPIYYDDIFTLYNSRRSYQISVFFCMLLSTILFGISRGKVLRGIIAIYFFVCVGFLLRKICHWSTAARVQYTLLEGLNPDEDRPTILLNVPAYFQDVRVLPADKDQAFPGQRTLFTGKPHPSSLYTVSSYNMLHDWDGAHVTVVDSQTLKVTLNQWGTWWMWNYAGAGSYENDLFVFELTDPGHEYHIRFKENPQQLNIFFQQGYQWKKVDLSRSAEQW